jgi:Holliday junction resolvasome RuvABC ATP-dependent DNA helicase subunit
MSTISQFLLKVREAYNTGLKGENLPDEHCNIVQGQIVEDAHEDENSNDISGPSNHLLLCGGSAVSSLASAISGVEDNNLRYTVVSCADLWIRGDLTAVLTNLSQNQVLILTNVHCLSDEWTEALKHVLEKGTLVISYETDTSERTHEMTISPFTLLGTCPSREKCPQELYRYFVSVIDADIEDEELICDG